ncbi:HupE/UreJ family protein [uncultured Litoreibacter sp.]|uniref:HupE/UreJ family protein n=2 Tax=uncultured Litoreibacter sp. TaxID=1392394 RepID=UPI002619CC65|nr:HupE/UreJ family protein [uncultured Litoreibacter sp.]
MGHLSKSVATRVAFLLAMSMVALFTFMSGALAHEIRPAIADATLSEERIELQITLNAETLVAGIDLEGLEDTDNAPEAALYDELRALPDAEFAKRLEAAWGQLQSGVIVDADGETVLLDLNSVKVIAQDDLELPRDSVIQLSGALPNNNSDVKIGWVAANGPIIVRQSGGGDDAYAGFLDKGALSEPLPRVGAATESGWAVFVRYIAVGFDHIIPKGLDHILFVLGLFFLSMKMRLLITQVTVFTVAHTITLALASLQIVTISASIVEPLIALSIVYVAVENIFAKGIKWWRPVIIFGFGLLHGLGFASVLGEFGLAPGRFVAGLIGFNIGVEVGQLAVIGIAALVLWLCVRAAHMADLDDEEMRVRDPDIMFRAVSICGSILIAIIGAYWAFERVFL